MSSRILLIAAREFRQIAAARSFWITMLTPFGERSNVLAIPVTAWRNCAADGKPLTVPSVNVTIWLYEPMMLS